jgi:hypothetical protein
MKPNIEKLTDWCKLGNDFILIKGCSFVVSRPFSEPTPFETSWLNWL